MTKQATVRWQSELRFEATDSTGSIVPMASNGETISPATLLLAALGGCSGMDTVSVMTKKQVAFDEYRIEVQGEQREAFPRAYTAITVEHVVRGRAVEDRAVARAIELSARKYCTVGATIAAGDTTINHRMRITDERGERVCDCISIGPKGKGLSHYEDA